MSDARLLATGRLEFQPQAHTICGLCRESFMLCTCTGLRHACDYVMVGLPRPAMNSTRAQLIQRWCSLVGMSMSMGVSNVDQWFRDNGQQLMISMEERDQLLHEMVDDYVAQLPQDVTLPKLAQIIGGGGGGGTSMTQAAQVQAVGAEAGVALESFLSGDWACMTYIGAMLLQNTFQVSDPQKYPLGDRHLQVLFEYGISCLISALGRGYDGNGWRLALEMDRSPVGTPSILPPASARFPDSN